jgi:hypothetical protein
MFAAVVSHSPLANVSVSSINELITLPLFVESFGWHVGNTVLALRVART